MVSEVKFDERRFSKERVVTISLLAVAFIFMIVGIVLMAVAASVKEVGKECASPSPSSHQEGQVRSTPKNILWDICYQNMVKKVFHLWAIFNNYSSSPNGL